MLNKNITENREKKTRTTKTDFKEKTRQTTKHKGLMKKSSAIESFDVVPFMKQKQRIQKKKEREKNKEPKESKNERHEGRKKEKSKKDTEKEKLKKGEAKKG